MGKIVQVNPPFGSVALPPQNRPFNAGASTTLTDAEYAALPAATLRAITVTNASVADPSRTNTGSPQSLADAVAMARAASVAVPAVGLQAGQLYGVDASGNTVGLNHQLAYSEDIAGTAYANLVNSVPTYVQGCVISVPATKRNVVLKYQVPFTVVTAGNGSVNATIYEWTSGSAVLIDLNGPGGAFLAGVGSSGPIGRGEYDLGATSTERVFALAGLMFLDAASTLVAKVKANTTFTHSFLKAVAE